MITVCRRLLPIAIAAACFAGHTQESTVPHEEAVRVEVRLQVPEAEVNHGLNLREIQKLSGAKAARGATSAVGFTQLTLEVGTRLQTGMRPGADGTASLWVEAVEVRVGYSAVTIFIPSEYAEGSCLYEAVLEHEREHVAGDHALLEDYAERLRERLRGVEWSSPAKPLQGLSEEQGKRRLEEMLAKVLRPSLNELKKKREQARDALDRRKDYEAMRRRCG